jgi:hypothetical protein
MTARGGRGDRRRGMCTGMLTEAVVCAGEVPANQRLLCSPAGRPPAGSAGHSGCGDHRGRAACCGDSRGSLGRDVRGMKRGRRSFAPIPATKAANLQVLYGSDGTRTRDLRRDRPSQAPRRLATNSSEQPHLQVFVTHQSARGRMVEPIVQSTFGPRVGHENLSQETTVCRIARHRATRRELIDVPNRELPATSCGMCAGCGVASIVNQRYVCGMRSLSWRANLPLGSERHETKRGGFPRR